MTSKLAELANLSGPTLAIYAAILFGISPALCKLVIGEMSPVLMAGLLYLGSGLGLQIVIRLQGKRTLSADEFC